MAMNNMTQFSHMVEVAISIGWTLKLNSKATNDEHNQIPYFSTVGGGVSFSSSILLLKKRSPKNILLKWFLMKKTCIV